MGRILQFSDIHFGCEHRRACAAALDYAHANPADLILITGDITQQGFPDEFAAAGEWIRRMPDPRFVIVGNHDVPYWSLFAEYAKLGLDPAMLLDLPPDVAIRIESLMGEELGWGDAGLAVSLIVAGFPVQMAAVIGNQELVELCTGRIGCWMITHPDKGSDVTMVDVTRELPAGQQGNKGRSPGVQLVHGSSSSPAVEGADRAAAASCPATRRQRTEVLTKH